jgi:glyoxylase-like metal-dependent hydrolase (beta-lactamase superfamily II)
MTVSRRRKRRIWLIILGIVLTIIVVAFVVILRGMHPLKDGQRLADGRVEVIADGFIGSYLIELKNGSFALVDAGFDPEAIAIITALDRRGLDVDDVTAIFLTHGHGDHIAGALRFPDAAVYALSEEVDLIEGRRTAGSSFAGGRDPKPTGVTVQRPVADGEVILLGGTKIEVFAVPGHTVGSAVFLIHGVLFMGDSAAAHGGGGITAAPPIFSTDRATNQLALVALADQLRPRADEVQTLAFGHQAPLQGLAPLLDWADANK